ncbi:MAG: YceI family protein [Verrucomicrobiota bacterium]
MKNITATLLAALVLGAGFSQSLQAAETYSIDATHSSVNFKIKHLGISWVNGSFKDYEGTVTFDPETPANSKISVSVDVTSVYTGSEDRDAHIQDDEYFNSAEWEKMTFESKKVEKTGDDTYKVTGDFTLRDVTKEITIEVTDLGGATGRQGEKRRGGETSFIIKRSDYGMEGGAPLVGDEVHISLAFSAVEEG